MGNVKRRHTLKWPALASLNSPVSKTPISQNTLGNRKFHLLEKQSKFKWLKSVLLWDSHFERDRETHSRNRKWRVGQMGNGPLIFTHTNLYKHTSLHCGRTFLACFSEAFVEQGKEEQRKLIIRSIKRTSHCEVWFIVIAVYVCVYMNLYSQEIEALCFDGSAQRRK